MSAGYDLFDGFKAVNNYKISKTGLLIADSQEKQVEADICLAVMEAYYNVVYYKRLCDVYEEQVAVAEQALVKAKRQEELGQKGHADVIQMEADLADRQYDLTNTLPGRWSLSPQARWWTSPSSIIRRCRSLPGKSSTPSGN